MKPFTEYLADINPIYEFIVRVANCEADQLREQIESALTMFKVTEVRAARRLPIQEHADFLGMGPCEVQVFEIKLTYPTISEQIRHIIAEKTGVAVKQVCVRTQREELLHEYKPAEPVKGKDGSILNNPNLDAESAQDLVGTQRTENMLKELQGLTRKYDIAAEGETSKSIDMPQGRLSPVGSTKISKPSPKGK